MNTKDSIRHAYDLAAAEYAAAFWDEIDKKHFDQVMLKWFAAQIPPGEAVLEIGSGPGEVSGFLSRIGVKCISTDHSVLMIEQGEKYFPDVQFEVQDFFHLTYPDNTFPGVVAFYAIVNLKIPEIQRVVNEVKRVLKDHGLFLFTFHIKEEGKEGQIDTPEFLDKPGARLTFYFLEVEKIKGLVEKAGFRIVDIIIRYPYPEVEYPSRRAYFILRKGGN